MDMFLFDIHDIYLIMFYVSIFGIFHTPTYVYHVYILDIHDITHTPTCDLIFVSSTN